MNACSTSVSSLPSLRAHFYCAGRESSLSQCQTSLGQCFNTTSTVSVQCGNSSGVSLSRSYYYPVCTMCLVLFFTECHVEGFLCYSSSGIYPQLAAAVMGTELEHTACSTIATYIILCTIIHSTVHYMHRSIVQYLFKYVFRRHDSQQCLHDYLKLHARAELLHKAHKHSL